MRDSKNVKPEKKKHDHTFTDCLKAGIFSLVMLGPIFSIAVRCGYVMFNKNAYESYYGETINQKKYKQANELKINEEYTFVNSPSISQIINVQSWFKPTNITNYELPGANTSLINAIANNEVEYIYIAIYENQQLLAFRSNETTNIQNFNLLTTPIQFDFEMVSYNPNLDDNYLFLFNNIVYNNYSYLDNAFTYGIANLKNENVFNWTQNTAIYTPINAMCNGLGITEEAISIMLTYWILMIAIYIIVDMIIWIFTKLTHILQ